LSLREVADRYLADHAAKRKGSTHVLVTGILERNLLPVFGAMQPDKVTRADVARLHSAMHATPVAANRTLATLKALYGWAARHELVADGYNPARSIEKYAERARERFLTSDEFARLGDALDTCAVDPAAVAAIKLLILTGCRLREILELRWDYVDFDRAVIFLPDSKTGKKPVYLSAAALGILRNLPRRSDYVAPSRTGRPYADIKGPWATVTGVAGLEGLRLHDLRHSFASIGAGAGLGLPILGKLLGHSQAATTQRYAHLASDPMHQAVNTIGDAIEAAMKGADRKVVPLRKIAPDRG
jgi:integrase